MRQGMDDSKAGYVYVLSNPSMPGLTKIGRTNRHPATRASELTAATGVPTAFKLEGYVRSADAAMTEVAVHRQMDGKRINARREFFRVEVNEALAIARRVATSERLRLIVPHGRKQSWKILGAIHLLIVFLWFNAALHYALADQISVWKIAAANAALALLVPSRSLNLLMRRFSSSPWITHALIASAMVCAAMVYKHDFFGKMLGGVPI